MSLKRKKIKGKDEELIDSSLYKTAAAVVDFW